MRYLAAALAFLGSVAVYGYVVAVSPSVACPCTFIVLLGACAASEIASHPKPPTPPAEEVE